MTRGSTHLAVSTQLLPKEVPWVSLLAPIPTSFLLIPNLPSLSLAEAAEKISATYVPFAACTAALLAVYRWFMPWLLARLASRAMRGAAHVIVVTAMAVLISVLVRPLHSQLCGMEVPSPYFAITCVVISFIMVFPSLWIQAARTRAHAVEQLATAQRQAALRAQFEALQARTNPHFFFNSMNTVASLIHDDPALAEHTLERLADLFRYALDASKTTLVPLSREFEMVREFLAIESARFGERLQATVSLDPAAAGLMVPPLLLQPLVENAILHGLAKRSGGRVEVVARREGDQVFIDVRDDGPGPGSSSHQGTQTSVRDLLERVRLSFGGRGEFQLQEAPGGGCLARLALPCA